jgi:hypothetical protein
MTIAIINAAPQFEELVSAHLTTAKATNVALSTPKVHVDNGATGTAKYNITVADAATTLAELLPLVQDILNCVLNHATDNYSARGATGSAAHKVVDTTLSATYVPSYVVDLTTAVATVNAVKAWYNTHRASTTYHGVADSTNATAATDATDLASAITLANELKTDINAHLALALASQPVIQKL